MTTPSVPSSSLPSVSSLRHGLVAVLAVLAGTLCSCAMMHDAGKPAPQIAPEQIRLADDLHLARDGWPQARWWTAYGDPQLDALVDFALKNGPDARVFRARLEQARAQVAGAEAAGMPFVGAEGYVDRERVSGNSFLFPFAANHPGTEFTGPWYTEGLVGVGGVYTVDLWGEDRARVRAAIGVENARIAECAAVELDVAAAVAQLYFSYQSVQQVTTILEQALAVQADSVASHRAWAERGLEPITRPAEAEAARLQIERQLTGTRTQARQLRETLRAVVGAHADDLPALEPAPLPTTQGGVPGELSYELLARRPDLQAMRWYVQASLDQVEVAKAMFYPRLDLRAFFGLDSIHLSHLFETGSGIVHLGPSVSLPIFDGGRLRANLKSARAASDTTIEQYNGAVLRAVRDVAVTGTRLEGLLEQERLQEARVAQAEIALESARQHAERGLLSRSRSFEAELPVLLLRADLVEVRARRIAEHVALVKVLGGGYEDPKRHAAADHAERHAAADHAERHAAAPSSPAAAAAGSSTGVAGAVR